MIMNASAGWNYHVSRGITLSKHTTWNIPYHMPIEDAILRNRFLPLIE